MDCRTALATRLLGDSATATERHQADRHLAECPACSSTLLLEPVRDDDRPPERRSLAHRLSRWTLLISALVQLGLALPWLFGTDPLGGLGQDPDAAHLTRDGAIGLFVAAAGLAAWRDPRWAAPAATAIGLGGVGQLVAGVIDHQREHVHGWFEMLHLMTLGILALTVAEAFRARRRFRHPRRQPPLRPVPD